MGKKLAKKLLWFFNIEDGMSIEADLEDPRGYRKNVVCLIGKVVMMTAFGPER